MRGDPMVIHVVQAGETLFSIARAYGLPPETVAAQNGLKSPYPLAVGQSLGLFFPEVTAVAEPGDTLFSIGARYGVGVTELWRQNPQLGGGTVLQVGQRLTVVPETRGTRQVELSGYAYSFVQPGLLRQILPYATYLSPFTYGLGREGGLVKPEDEPLVALAKEYGTVPLLHLSSLTEEGSFSSQRAAELLGDPARQEALAETILRRMEEAGYRGLDVDFEYVGRENAAAYAAFVERLNRRLKPLGQELFVALAPKTSADQPGVLYEGHDYAALGAASDGVLLMSYEWGYTFGPAMAVAPLASVRRVLDFAVTQVPPEKMFLGFPNYGYDWTLPYVAGQSRARSISNEYAPLLAAEQRAEIQFDQTAAAPWFAYTDEDGRVHEVWFEDVRSAAAKFSLVPEYGLRGVGYWNFMRPFTVSFLLLDQMFALVKKEAI